MPIIQFHGFVFTPFDNMIRSSLFSEYDFLRETLPFFLVYFVCLMVDLVTLKMVLLKKVLTFLVILLWVGFFLPYSCMLIIAILYDVISWVMPLPFSWEILYSRPTELAHILIYSILAICSVMYFGRKSQVANRMKKVSKPYLWGVGICISVLFIIFNCWPLFCEMWHSRFPDAIIRGDINKVKSLLVKNPRLAKGNDFHAQTPLHLAASNSHVDLTELLLEYGANVNAKNVYGQISLHIAAEKGKKEVVEFLIAHNANINERDDWGVTPLNKAACHGDKDLVAFLVANGADVNPVDEPENTPLDSAVSCGNKEVVEFLISQGANIVDLYKPSHNGHKEIVEILIAHGAKIGNAMNIAAKMNHKDIVQLLLSKGADVNNKDGLGWTPLYGAVNSEHREMIKFLISRGADLNAKDNYGYTPLHRADLYGNSNQDIINILISSGADINASNNEGMTPLHCAVEGGWLNKVELLINHNAEINAKDNSGKTPLAIAIKERDKEIANLLRKHGAVE